MTGTHINISGLPAVAVLNAVGALGTSAVYSPRDGPKHHEHSLARARESARQIELHDLATRSMVGPKSLAIEGKRATGERHSG